MNMGASLVADAIVIAFALVVSGCGFLYFLNKGHTVAEAGAYGLMTMLMLQSWTAQVLLMVGAQQWQMIVHGLLTLTVIALAGSRWRLIFPAHAGGLGFLRNHRLPACSIGCGFASLAVLNLWLFRYDHASPGLSYISTHWDPYSSMFSWYGANPLPAVPVLNHAILLAGWQPPVMVQTANLCAWLIIALCTYALARRNAWPDTAITVTLVVISMPRIILQVFVPNSELLPAAAAIMAILALYRAVEEPHGRDLVMLAAAIGFSVAGGRLCYLMPIVLFLLSVIVLGRRHHFRLWPSAIAGHPMILIAALAAGLVFSQLGGIVFNLLNGQPWIGVLPGDELVFNADGIVAAGANMARYMLQALHMPDFFDHYVQQAFGFSPLTALQSLYRKTVLAAVGAKGAAVPFNLSWAGLNPFTWFGPAGFFLILPSVAYAIRKGPRRLKNTVSAMAVYWVLIALILAWRPQNVHLMTSFFVCSGFCTAFFLPPWRISRNGRLVLQLFAIFIGGYTILS